MKAIAVYGVLMASILLSIPPAHGGLTHGPDAASTWAFMIDNPPGLRNVPFQTSDIRPSLLWAAPSVTTGRSAVPVTNTRFDRHLALVDDPTRGEGTRDKRMSVPSVLPIDTVFDTDTMADTGGHTLPGISTLSHAGSDFEGHGWKAGDSGWRTRRGTWIRVTAQSIPAPEAVVLAALSTSLIGWLRRPRMM